MNQEKNTQNFSKFLQLLFVNKDYDGVIKESEIFLQNNAPNPVIYNFLGLSQFNQAKYKESIISFKKGISLDKNNFFLFQNLFYSYLNLHLKFSAIKSALSVIKLNTQVVDAYIWIYGLLNCNKSKNKILKKLCKHVNFEKVKIPNNFFNFLLINEEYETGIFVCKILLKSKNNHIVYNILGQFYFLNEQLELAKQSQLKSLSLKNDYYQSYYDLAEIFKIQGDLREAKNYYMQAIKYSNQNVDGELHRSFSSVHKYKSLEDEHVILMQKLLLSEKLNERNKSQLNFALAKAYEDIKEFELSYNSFNTANKLYFKTLNYSSEFFTKEVSIFKNFYLKNKKNLTGEKKIGFLESNPIFIIGLPRSGSTLVEQIISSHSQVTSYGESKLFGRSLSMFFNVYDLNIFQKQLNNVTDSFYYKLGKEYSLKINKHLDFKYFTDKMLFNFCYLGLIKYSLPNAKIIYCERDYRDIFLSIYKNFFSEVKMGFSFDKKELINFIIFFDQTIGFWLKELKNDIFSLSYEDLIDHPKTIVNQILNFCNLPYDEKCLEFYQNKSEVRTVSSVQVRQNFYSSSISLWKSYEKFLSKEFNQLELLMHKSKDR